MKWWNEEKWKILKCRENENEAKKKEKYIVIINLYLVKTVKNENVLKEQKRIREKKTFNEISFFH